ncbi:hypothetical protein FPSE5266_20161 [Fusarium pseudograminearum]|nr:hypothetical protein FPSE5266_20161 [Fusarium pseudograminearum]
MRRGARPAGRKLDEIPEGYRKRQSFLPQEERSIVWRQAKVICLTPSAEGVARKHQGIEYITPKDANNPRGLEKGAISNLDRCSHAMSLTPM